MGRGVLNMISQINQRIGHLLKMIMKILISSFQMGHAVLFLLQNTIVEVCHCEKWIGFSEKSTNKIAFLSKCYDAIGEERIIDLGQA